MGALAAYPRELHEKPLHSERGDCLVYTWKIRGYRSLLFLRGRAYGNCWHTALRYDVVIFCFLSLEDLVFPLEDYFFSKMEQHATLQENLGLC